MKGFVRGDRFLSLCGLNCGLCPMHVDGRCPGCGGGPGNQACRLARCSLDHGGVAYCFQCAAYPCEHYAEIDAYDSFITHRNQRADLAKAARIGPEAYGAEQAEKVSILRYLLENCNDGRRKSFFCTSVNLLDLPALREILPQLTAMEASPLPERGAAAVRLLQEAAAARQIDCRLRRKK